MADLIDRQALIAALGEQMDRCPLSYLWGLDKAVTTANKLPAVDAIEVVRCKDCQYLENAECNCPYIFISDGAHYYPAANDFCSYGERREENAAD